MPCMLRLTEPLSDAAAPGPCHCVLGEVSKDTSAQHPAQIARPFDGERSNAGHCSGSAEYSSTMFPLTTAPITLGTAQLELY